MTTRKSIIGITLASILSFALAAIVASFNVAVADISGGAGEKNPESIVVRDSVVMLGPKTIPAKDYIHLYDTTPYMIMNGHIAAKLPCDDNYESSLQILTGTAPDLKPAEFELIRELSTPGNLCLYHVDLESNPNSNGGDGAITDVAIYNPNDRSTRLPGTSSVVIGINEIMPIAHDGEKHGSEDNGLS